MTPLDRRRFLKWSSASVAALGLAGMPRFLRRTQAAPVANGNKLFFIFLRGGLDGIQFVIPYGDTGGTQKTYLEARGNIAVPQVDAHDLGNSFAWLNPSCQDTSVPDGPRLADIFHGTLDVASQVRLALMHRVGYANQNRSHFSSQRIWENGVPTSIALEEGVLNRYVTSYRDPMSQLQAATLATNQMVMMKGPTLIPVLRSINDYALPPNVPLGVMGGPLGNHLPLAYGQTGFDPGVPYNPETYATGSTLLDSLQFFEENVIGVPYSPELEAIPYYEAISDRGFSNFIKDSARLLKQVDALEIVGANMGGYDTHGAENQSFPRLMRDLSLAFTALFYDLQPIWNRCLVTTMSEFGRTSDVNGNSGTDHAESTCMMCMGESVNGGVYNCDTTTWSPGDMYSTSNGRYLAHNTDFRNIYQEILTKHLGDPEGHIDTIIPDFSSLAAENTGGYFTPLDFLA